jgi:hypothetical protein
LVLALGFEDGSGTTARDSSGRGNTGTLAGPTWTSGRFGGAVTFDGINDWISIAAAPSLDLGAAMTLEAWVYPLPGGSTSWRTVLARETASGVTYYLDAASPPGGPAGGLQTASGYADARASGALSQSAWSHVAATYDG